MPPNEKMHLSFPLLKYPSLRDEGLKDPVQWMEGKAIDDAVGTLWRIHDKLYDLSDFISRHPGGRDWLELTKGTDITEAFEVHHLTDAPRDLLPTFYIKEAETPRNSPFTFKEDGFYNTLKNRIITEMKKIDIDKYERKTRLIIDGLFTAVLILSVLLCLVQSYVVLLPVLVLGGLMLAWCSICSHNYFHKKDNWRMYLFYLTTISYRDWRISHALSHHLFPNTLFDLEISGFEPLLNYLPNKGHNYTIILLSPFVYMTALWMQSIRKYVLAFTKPGFFKRYFRWDDILTFALPLWMYLASGAPLGTVIIRWITLVTMQSLIFAFIGLNAAHHHPDIFHDGDEPSTETPDWGIFQLESVMDRVDINGSLFKVLTNFGDHGIHHLFPTIDHAVLPLLYPTFYEVCDEFNTKLEMSTQMQLIIGQFKQLLRNETKSKKK